MNEKHKNGTSLLPDHTDDRVTVKECIKRFQWAYTFYKAAKWLCVRSIVCNVKLVRVQKDLYHQTLLTVLLWCWNVFPQYRRITTLFLTRSVQRQLAPSQTKLSFHWLHLIVTPNPLEVCYDSSHYHCWNVKKGYRFTIRIWNQGPPILWSF